MFKLTALILSLISSLVLSSHLVFAKEEKREQEHENPTWTFKVDKTKGSAPLLVTFDASGIRPAKKFYWSFGNGDTLVTNKSIVSYEYKTPGTYTASLKFAVEANEKDLKELKNAGRKTITAINLPPIANLACSANYLLINCNGLGSIDPENQPLQYTFTYADGFTETNSTGLSSHAFLLAGLYNVQLAVKDVFGITSSSTISVQALRPPNKLPVLALNCSSDKINILKCDAIGSNDLDGTIASFSYAWDDGASDSKADTAAIEHTFSAPGAHSVTLTAVDNDGGVSTLTKSFSVKANANPIASFTCDNSKPQKLTCHSTSTDPDVGDTIQSYSWTFGASAVSTMTPDVDYSFSAGGSVVVSLAATDSYGGVGTVTQTIAVKNNTPPIANFSCTNTGVRAIHCDSSSTDSDGTIASTSWSLDDGTNLTGTSFDHTFTDDQAHAINLTITDDLGASTSLNQTVQPLQNQAPKGNLVASTLSGIAPLAVNFTAQNVVDPDGTVAAIDWTFSDGGTASGAVVSHTFNNSGTFTATMKLTDNLGAVTTKSVSITSLEPLKTPPAAFFKFFQDGTYLELHSSLTKTQFDFQRAYYTVDNSKTIELSEFYPNTINTVDVGNFGQHAITLTVVDVRGQIGTFTHTFNLQQDLTKVIPYAGFKVIQSSPLTVFLNLNLAFTSDRDASISNYHIDYGNGVVQDSSDLYTTYTYPKAGTYQIKVTATTTKGTQATTSRNIAVTNTTVPVVQPVASFGYRIYSVAQNITFYNEKSGSPNGGVISYLWDFGDGTTGTGESAAHFYEPGSYLVTLTVTDFAGYKSSQTQHITVSGVGDDILAFIDCTDLGNKSVDCTIVALDKYNQINHLKVDWGDNSSDLVTNVVNANQGFYQAGHTYSSGGNKNINFAVGTERGVGKITNQNVSVFDPAPVAKILCTTSLLNVNCNGFDSFDPKGVSIQSYTIDYGNGDSATNTTGLFNYRYPAAGSYTITLSVKNASGLIGSASTQVTIVNLAPVASINCVPNNMLVECNALGSYDPEGAALTYEFDFGDGQVDLNSTGVPSAHVYSVAGLYSVKLKVTDDVGNIAIATTQVQAVLPPNQLPVARLNCYSNSPKTVTCAGNNSYDNDGSIISYKFDWDDNSSDISGDGQVVTHVFQEGGSHQVTLTVMDNDGGVGLTTSSLDVLFNHSPVASMNCYDQGPQKIHCDSNSSDPDPGDQIVEYKWDLGDGTVLTSLIPSVDYTYSASSTYTISLAVKDSFGASASASQDITTIENQAPIANINCFVTTGTTYQCNSNATDRDGTIAESVWTIEGQTFSGASALYEFTNGGDKIISLKLTDNLGKLAIFTTTIAINKPLANFTCNETTPMVYQCLAPAIVSTDPSDPVDVVYYTFDNRDMLPGQNVEYEFYSFGTHKVEIKVQTLSGNIATYKQDITIAPKYLAPRPEFVEDILLQQKVYFDASLSEQVGRTVTAYEWDFGDGQTFTSTNPTTNHQYNSYGWFDVKLKVTDATGAIAQSTTPVYVYDPEVDAPGDEGFATIEGVDADNNGIRDDVQRWINKNSYDSMAAKKAFVALVSVYKAQIANSDDIVTLQSLENQKAEIAACLDSEIVGEHDVTKSVEFEIIYNNTNDRLLNFAKVKGNLSGYVPSFIPTSATDPCAKWR